MPGNTPTRDFSVNDIVYNVGVLAATVEGMGQEIGRLRGAIEKIHCPKEAEISAIGAASATNASDIVEIKKKMAATENFARGGLSVGRWFALAIVWIVMTGIPGAVYAWKIVKSSTVTTAPAPAQTQVTP